MYIFPKALSIGRRIILLCWFGTASCYPQANTADGALARAIDRESVAANEHHPHAVLFEVNLANITPSILGSDCSASAEISSAYSIGSETKFIRATGVFFACNGDAKKDMDVAEQNFKAIPCMPRHPVEEQTKSCGGPVDESEPQSMHMPLELREVRISTALRNLQEAGVDLALPFDVRITTAIRASSLPKESDLGGIALEMAEHLDSLAPAAVVIVFRGRQTKRNDGTTVGVVNGGTGAVLYLNQGIPLQLIPPSRPSQ